MCLNCLSRLVAREAMRVEIENLATAAAIDPRRHAGSKVGSRELERRDGQRLSRGSAGDYVPITRA